MALNNAKLDFWIQKNYNVLFIGKHGVGKTAMITQAFNRANLRWKYFSASTLDPWVDFCGTPYKRIDGDQEYLDLLRPKDFNNDEVEAIFMDEYNRSHKKVRNAVMELIQFKSINGKKFNNLRIVWAAINPDDDDTEDYDVEKLDPAQQDRFHVHCYVPYKPVLRYFVKEYGKEIAEAGVSWWNELPKEMKDAISPRRLDYALQMKQDGGDLRDVLPKGCNINKLLITLRDGPIKKRLQEFLKSKDLDEAKKFITVENNYAAAIQYILKTDAFMEFFLPMLKPEKLASLLVSSKKAREYVTKNAKKPVFFDAINNIIQANKNRKLVRQLKTLLPKTVKTKVKGMAWLDQVLELYKRPDYNTTMRVNTFFKIKNNIPATISLEEAMKTGSLLNKLVKRSTRYIIRRDMKGIDKILSLCFSRIAHESNDKTKSDICNTMRWGAIDKKIKDNEIKIEPIAESKAVPNIVSSSSSTSGPRPVKTQKIAGIDALSQHGAVEWKTVSSK
jgi:hypothetical protein